jgi:GT2 family glycosyltransferase
VSGAKGPAVSVVVVAYRQRRDLDRLLPTIGAAGGHPQELIVVDNADTPGDDTHAWLADEWPDVVVLTGHGNLGYAAGNNLGLERARGEYVLILNPDTALEPGSIDRMVEAARPGAFVNPCLVLPDGRVNAVGLSVGPTGIATCQGLYGVPPHGGPFGVPALSGAAILGRRADWQAVGGFLPEYFLYGEDVEWSLRARLQGFRLVCAPSARVVHWYRRDIGPDKWYFLSRNRRYTLSVVLSHATRRRIAPLLRAADLALAVYAAWRGPRYLAAELRAARWTKRHRALAARRLADLSDRRRLSDQVLLADWAHGAIPLPGGGFVGGPVPGWIARWLGRRMGVSA